MPAITSGHPTKSALAAFALGKLGPAAAETVTTHLAGCADCRTVVESTPGDALLSLLKKAAPGAGDTRSVASILSGTLSQPNPALDEADLPQELRNHPRYRIVRKLGHGGMGAVYEAEHKLMERIVAVKVIAANFVDNPGAAERFQREVRAAAKLDHANIVRAFDADQAGGSMLLAMEFVKGRTLAEVVTKKGPLPVAYACQCVRQAALGLQHAADRGMVHRDIKPQNLMLTDKGVVKILDFGLAKLASERASRAGLTGHDIIMGTPDYMAPEQARDTAAADVRADIYALGCTLFYLLTGRPPFSGSSAIDILAKHAMDTPPRVTELRPDVPAGLADVIGRMLEKDPAARPQTPREVAEALKAYMKPSGMTPPPTTRLDVAPAARRRRLIPAAVAMGLVLIGVGLWAGGVFKVKTRDGTIVLENLPADAEVTVDGEKATLKTGDGQTATVSVAAGKKRRLQVKKDGFTTFGEEVEIDAGGSRTITVRLEPAAGRPGADDAGFVPLFNGKDLTGWVADGGGENAWQVEDGELVMRGTEQDDRDSRLAQSYLLTERNYSDFVVRFQFRRNADTAKTGIALRAVPGETARASEPEKNPDFPYHLTVWMGKYKEQEATGGLWWSPDVGKAPPLLVDRLADLRPAGEWNDMEVEMRGQSLRIAVNGREVQNVMLNKTPPPKSFPAPGLSRFAGRVGFLKRTGEVRFRKIEIKELPAASLLPTKPAGEPGSAPAAVLAPENSEWAGIGVVKDEKGERPIGAAWTFTERRGQAFKALWRGGGGMKAIYEGIIDADHRITLDAREILAPQAKPREEFKGNGEVGSERMVLVIENPNGATTRIDFKRLSDGGEGFQFAGRWMCFDQPSGWRGMRPVNEDGTLFQGKDKHHWTRDGGIIYISFGQWLVIDPDKPNELNGAGGPLTVRWIRQ